MRHCFKGILAVAGAIAVAALGMTAGCGYTTRSVLPAQMNTIYIAPFVNKIDISTESSNSKYRVYRPMLESDVTRVVTNKFLFDGSLKPVPRDTADASLEGELIEFRRDPLRYTPNDDVEEYRLNIVVSLRCIDNRTGALLWQDARLTGDTTYFTIGPSAISEDAAIPKALDDLARRIVERTVEQW